MRASQQNDIIHIRERRNWLEPRPTTGPFSVVTKVIPSELPSELSPKLMRTIEYATCRATRLGNNRTSKKTGWIPAQDLPRRNCQGPYQPCHGILAQQCDAIQHTVRQMYGEAVVRDVANLGTATQESVRNLGQTIPFRTSAT